MSEVTIHLYCQSADGKIEDTQHTVDLSAGQSQMSSSSAGSFSPGSIASVSEAETCSGQTGREKRILLSSPYAIALGARARHKAFLRRSGLRSARRAASSTRASWAAAVCLGVKPVGKPDAGCDRRS